jgi:hypothetical protein
VSTFGAEPDDPPLLLSGAGLGWDDIGAISPALPGLTPPQPASSTPAVSTAKVMLKPR